MARPHYHNTADPVAYSNGCRVVSLHELALANHVVTEYAHLRRNCLAIPYQTQTSKNVYDITHGWWTAFHIPACPRAGHVHLWVLYKLQNSEDPDATLLYSFGSSDTPFLQGELPMAGHDVYKWECFDLGTRQSGLITSEVHSDVDAFDDSVGGGNLTMRFVARDEGGSNLIDIMCYGYHTLADTNYADFVDLSGATCKVGVADQPHSVLQSHRLVENALAVQHRRGAGWMGCHWFGPYSKDSASYGTDPANNAALGWYKLVKPAGVDTVYVDLCIDIAAGATYTLRTELGSTVEGSQESAGLTTGAGGDALWMSHKYTFAGADITNELEIELLIDGKRTAGKSGGIQIPGVHLRPKYLSEAAIGHALPLISDCFPGRNISATKIQDRERDTLQHLWKRGGFTRLMADWRWTATAKDGTMQPSSANPDKGDHGIYASTVARGIVWPSYGVTRLAVRTLFRVRYADFSAGDARIWVVLSDSMTEETNDDDGPLPAGPWEFNPGQFLPEDIYDGWVFPMVTTVLDIGSGDWDTPDGTLTRAGTVPLQFWVFMTSAGASEFFDPIWVEAHEIGLLDSEM